MGTEFFLGKLVQMVTSTMSVEVRVVFLMVPGSTAGVGRE